jgi:hypothetical protein
MSLVLDSPATLAWIYGDETTDAIRAIFEEVADSGAIVPALWHLEVANGLIVAVRRGRIDAELRPAALTDLALLDIAVGQPTERGTTRCVWPISFGYRCTMLPIWNSRDGGTYRWPRSIRTFAPPR